MQRTPQTQSRRQMTPRRRRAWAAASLARLRSLAGCCCPARWLSPPPLRTPRVCSRASASGRGCRTCAFAERPASSVPSVSETTAPLRSASVSPDHETPIDSPASGDAAAGPSRRCCVPARPLWAPSTRPLPHFPADACAAVAAAQARRCPSPPLRCSDRCRLSRWERSRRGTQTCKPRGRP